MADRITTRAAAIEEMLRWANGERTCWNQMKGEAGPDGLSPADIALCTLADAAEVQKWAAVAGVLGDAGSASVSIEAARKAARLNQALRDAVEHAIVHLDRAVETVGEERRTRIDQARQALRSIPGE